MLLTKDHYLYEGLLCLVHATAFGRFRISRIHHYSYRQNSLIALNILSALLVRHCLPTTTSNHGSSYCLRSSSFSRMSQNCGKAECSLFRLVSCIRALCTEVSSSLSVPCQSISLYYGKNPIVWMDHSLCSHSSIEERPRHFQVSVIMKRLL